jgi:hypothetical protein
MMALRKDWLAGESACPTKAPLPDGRGSDSTPRTASEAIRATTVREWLLEANP